MKSLINSFFNYKSIFISIILTFSLAETVGQLNQVYKVNTSSAEQYFKIADLLQADIEPKSSDWLALFNSSIYEMMIAGNAIDTSELKSVMKKIFKPSTIQFSLKHLTPIEKDEVIKFHKLLIK